MKYLKESYKNLHYTDQISPGHRSNISMTPSNISRTPIKYLQDTYQVSPGYLSNISGTPIKYLQDINHISLGHPSNITTTPIKYNHETDQVSIRH